MTKRRKIPLHKKEYESWKRFPDFKYKQKKIGKYIIEFLGGIDRGAQIDIWEPGHEKLTHIWTNSDNNKYVKMTQANFMYYDNADARYTEIKTVSDLFDLIRETF